MKIIENNIGSMKIDADFLLFRIITIKNCFNSPRALNRAMKNFPYQRKIIKVPLQGPSCCKRGKLSRSFSLKDNTRQRKINVVEGDVFSIDPPDACMGALKDFFFSTFFFKHPIDDPFQRFFFPRGFSYSHVDKEEWLPRFQAKFKPLERLAQITLWDDSQIRVGDDWYEEIDKALKCCKVAILLISDGFLSSPFITEKEFPELLTRHQQGGMRLYPVLIKSCLWERDPELARLQIKMARGESPLEKLCSEDAALNEELTAIAREIVDIIQPR